MLGQACYWRPASAQVTGIATFTKSRRPRGFLARPAVSETHPGRGKHAAAWSSFLFEPGVSVLPANGDIHTSTDELTRHVRRALTTHRYWRVAWFPRSGTMFGVHKKTCIRDTRYEAVAIGLSRRPGDSSSWPLHDCRDCASSMRSEGMSTHLFRIPSLSGPSTARPTTG